MINLKHLLKVSMVWVTVAYSICFLGVWLFPSMRENFMKYALHTTELSFGQNYMTLGSFISGLIVWNVIALASVWLFTALFNKIKQ